MTVAEHGETTTETHTSSDAVEAIQWAPSGFLLDGVPGPILRLLASPEGKTFGYAGGPGWSMGFGTEHGTIYVLPSQWVVKHADGRYSVSDTEPRLTNRAATLAPKEAP